MTKLTETQTIILSAGAKRPDKLAMLREPGGATMEEITTATDWRPHTARARCPVLWARNLD